MKILVADLESEALTQVVLFLQKEGFVVELYHQSMKAIERIRLYEYDCIILSFDLFGKEFFEVLEHLCRANKGEGIMITSKRITDSEKIKALNSGVDDVLKEPYLKEELTARIRAIVRRKKFQSKSKIYFGNLVIDLAEKSVIVWNTPLTLTKKEFEILLYLIANKNRVVPKNTLAEYIWGDNASEIDNYEALFTHIKNLRRKLKTAKAEVDFRSIYGVGYQIIES